MGDVLATINITASLTGIGVNSATVAKTVPVAIIADGESGFVSSLSSAVPISISGTGVTGYTASVSTAIPIGIVASAVFNTRSALINRPIAIAFSATGSVVPHIGAINKSISITSDIQADIPLDIIGAMASAVEITPQIDGWAIPSGSINVPVTIRATIGQTLSGLVLDKATVAAVVKQAPDSVVVDKGMVHAIVSRGDNVMVDKAVMYAVVVGTVIDVDEGYNAILFF